MPDASSAQGLSLSRVVVIVPVIVLLLAALASFIYGTDVFFRSVAHIVDDPKLTGPNLGFLLLLTDLFLIWWEHHRDRPVAIRALHEDVRQAADPQGRGRQFLASSLERLVGTRMAGFVLTRQAPVGTWGAATYSLEKTGPEEWHRGHRGHRVADPIPADPMTPMPPMPDGLGEIEHEEEEAWTL